MVNVQTNVIGDDRFSPGVGYCVPLDRQNCIDLSGKEHREFLENDWDSSVTCGYGSLDALHCCDLHVSETVWAGSGPGEADDVRLAPVDGDMDRRFVLPGSDLPDVPEMVIVTSQSASAVSWTDECVVAGFDVAVAVFLPDSCDWMGALDHPFGVPLLDGTSVTHPADIYGSVV